MSRRKIISMTEGIRNALVPSNLVSNPIVNDLALSGRITDMYDRMQQEALARYNADNFQAPVISQPDLNFNVPIEFPTQKSAPKSRAYSMSGSQFTNNLYNAYKTELINSGTRETDADRLALMLTRQSAMETGFGKHIAANHNYGGHRVNGKYINYKDDADYARAHIKLLDKKWSRWRTANNDIEFGKAIHTGNQKYSEIKGSDYGQRMSGTSNKVNDYLNMGRRKLRCGGKVSRPKAFLGAIATVASVAGGLIKNIMAKNQREYDAKVQLANQKYAMGVKEAAAMTEALNQSRDYQENYLNQFRMPYAGGGRRSKISGDVKLTAGGPALNLSTGRLYHYGEELPNGRYIDFGPSHETKNEHGGTGTDWRVNGRPIETKGGEVIDVDDNGMFVYSDDNKVGIPTDKGRIAPAKAILSGINTQFVRNIQQMQNGNFGDTRDTRRRLRSIKGKPYGKDHALIMAMKNGGTATRPVEEIVSSPISGIRRNMANGGRIKAEGGLVTALRNAYNGVRDSWAGDVWRALNANIVNDNQNEQIVFPNGYIYNIPGLQTGAPNYLPGRAGGFRRTDIKGAVNTTRNIANKVTQAVRRSTPKNTPKPTRGHRILNSNEGDLTNLVKKDARGYSWTHSKPFEQTGYTNTHISVDPNKVNPYTGQIPFYTIGDGLRSYPWSTIGGLGLGFGTIAGINYAINNNENQNSYSASENAREEIKRNTNENRNININNSTGGGIRGANYVTSAARGNNSAPFDAIQIGVTPDKLSSVKVNIPIVGAQFYSPAAGARVGRRNRGIAAAGARPNVTPFTPGELSHNIYDNRSPYEIMRDNGFTEQGKNVIAPLEEDTVQRETPVNLNGESDLNVNVSANGNKLDWFNIGLTGLNIGGKLLGGLLTDRSLKNMPTPTAPLSYSAAKLPTVYNITPQLAQNQLLRSRLMSDANESSSSVARYQRRNYANTYVNTLNNNLFGEKTNKENELLAADALNSQAQYTRSISDYNNFLKSYNDYERDRNTLRTYNRDETISGIVRAINDYDTQRRQNISDRLAINWYLSTFKDKDRRYFLRNAGKNLVDFNALG